MINPKIHYKFFDRNFSKINHIYKQDNSTSLADIEIIKQDLNLDRLILLNQVHGETIYYDNGYETSTTWPIADASLTENSKVGLGIYTADCVPVLLTESSGKLIGAAHCGWKGALSSLIPNVVSSMKQYSNKLQAILGPCIQQNSYQVDNILMDSFLAENVLNRQFFITDIQKNDRFLFDLKGYVIAKLVNLGVEIYADSNENTYTSEKCFSHRLNSHQNIQSQQRILSVICKNN